MQINTDGLIIREQSIGESDRLVTVLTREQGILRAFVRGAKAMKSRSASSTQLLCYSRLSIYEGREKYIIDEAEPIEVFFSLRTDFEKLSLAQYFCELALALAPDGEYVVYARITDRAGNVTCLRSDGMVLDALYFLGKGKLPAAQIKAIVEMRMLSLAGFMPDLVCCAQCGAYEADQMYFMVKQGSLYCGSCYPQFAPGGVLMNRGVTTALRHTIYADFNKVFSFTLPAKDLEALAKASERYLLNTVERGFATLDFYKQICVPSSPDI